MRWYVLCSSSGKSCTSRTASRGTIHSASDSCRRPYCSRANASANTASGADTEPAWANAAPFFSCRKTSKITLPPSPAARSRGGNPVSPAGPLLAAAGAARRRVLSGEPVGSPAPPPGRLTSSRGFGQHDRAHPRLLLEHPPTQFESLLRLRTVPRDDAFQLVPVRLAVLPHPVVVLAQLRIRNRQAELPDLRHVAVEELLPRLLVALRLDPPDVHRVVLGGDRIAVELHQRSPPARQRLLHQLALPFGAVHQGEDHVAPVQDVERLLPADLLHDPRVRRVRALEQRLLGDDRGRVDEPGDHADVAPRLRRVVEDVMELRLAGDQVGEASLARLAEVLDDAVDQLRVPDLVLHLRGQRELALQRRRAEDPLALGQDAHQLRVAVHLDELDELRAVVVRHPVARLDLAAGLDVLEELLLVHAADLNERSLG